MAAITVTYSHKLNGWTSFFSYTPEWMIGMNTNFYSMSDGNLYRHRDNATRNNFYGVQYNSTIQTVFNDAPLDAKMFKTIGLEGDDPWTAAITTDFGTGAIDSTYFQLKEGDYYAYIRRDSGATDVDLMSAQGIGVPLSVTGTAPGVITITFSFDIGNIISDGDAAYVGGVSALTLIGTISSHTSTSITINTSSATPIVTDFIMYLKDAVAESYGARGYYMEITLTNTTTTAVELFAITSEVFKSYP